MKGGGARRRTSGNDFNFKEKRTQMGDDEKAKQDRSKIRCIFCVEPWKQQRGEKEISNPFGLFHCRHSAKHSENQDWFFLIFIFSLMSVQRFHAC